MNTINTLFSSSIVLVNGMCKSSHVKDKHFYFSSHFFKNLENLCPHFSSGHFLAFLNDELALNDLTFNDRPDKL